MPLGTTHALGPTNTTAACLRAVARPLIASACHSIRITGVALIGRLIARILTIGVLAVRGMERCARIPCANTVPCRIAGIRRSTESEIITRGSNRLGSRTVVERFVASLAAIVVVVADGGSAGVAAADAKTGTIAAIGDRAVRVVIAVGVCRIVCRASEDRIPAQAIGVEAALTAIIVIVTDERGARITGVIDAIASVAGVAAVAGIVVAADRTVGVDTVAVTALPAHRVDIHAALAAVRIQPARSRTRRLGSRQTRTGDASITVETGPGRAVVAVLAGAIVHIERITGTGADAPPARAIRLIGAGLTTVVVVIAESVAIERIEAGVVRIIRVTADDTCIIAGITAAYTGARRSARAPVSTAIAEVIIATVDAGNGRGITRVAGLAASILTRQRQADSTTELILCIARTGRRPTKADPRLTTILVDLDVHRIDRVHRRCTDTGAAAAAAGTIVIARTRDAAERLAVIRSVTHVDTETAGTIRILRARITYVTTGTEQGVVARHAVWIGGRTCIGEFIARLTTVVVVVAAISPAIRTRVDILADTGTSETDLRTITEELVVTRRAVRIRQ